VTSVERQTPGACPHIAAKTFAIRSHASGKLQYAVLDVIHGRLLQFCVLSGYETT